MPSRPWPPKRRARAHLRSPGGAAATLAVSVVAYVVVTLYGAEPFGMIDLRVYYDSAHHLFDDTSLYSFQASATIGLPFTYPPFAALLFTPLAWLPWTACRAVWQIASVGALGVACYVSLGLADDSAARRTRRDRMVDATFVTAFGLWTEPVRSGLTYGQINLFIVAALLAGLAARRSWVSGATVGLCAAVKLIPGITGLYYLLAGRFRAIAAAAVTVLSAVVVSVFISPGLTRQFFTDTIFNPGRAGDLAAVNNQSLRGALARVLHHDEPVVWAVAAVAVVAVGVAATLTCLRHRDQLGGFLVVQFTGLLVSPISWNHHWVWALPLIIWTARGPLRARRLIRSLGVVWTVAVCCFLVSIQIAQQTRNHGLASTGWVPWTESTYPVLGVITVIAVWIGHRRNATVVPGSVSASGPTAPNAAPVNGRTSGRRFRAAAPDTAGSRPRC